MFLKILAMLLLGIWYLWLLGVVITLSYALYHILKSDKDERHAMNWIDFASVLFLSALWPITTSWLLLYNPGPKEAEFIKFINE